jgi:hypothetical protein
MKFEVFLSQNPQNYAMLSKSLGVNSRKPVGSVDFDLVTPLFKTHPLKIIRRPNRANSKGSRVTNKRTQRQRLIQRITLADNNPNAPQRALRQVTPFRFGLNFHFLP